MVNSTTVSVFDDHCCNITGAGVYLNATGPSRGLILKLNLQKRTVRVEKQYSHGVTTESRYMGNVQPLAGGGAFVGWGDLPFFSEFNKAGAIVFDAAFPTPDISYRAYLQKWVGLPTDPPSGAARASAGQTTVYASWNGATRLKGWRVLSLTGSGSRVVAKASESGFETAIKVGSGTRFELQALDGAGKVIGTSKSFSAHG
jgi:hypothetical protein